MLITTENGLQKYCDGVVDADILYLDTEFIGEDSYYPRLEIIQIMADDQLALIDVPAIGNLDSLWRLLHNPNALKVFHAASQDLALLCRASGGALRNVYDTQIAAAFAGIGEQVGYGELVRLATGTLLAKGHSYSAWDKRPLTEAQIQYAEDDVRYLPMALDFLNARLDELKRSDWLAEEFRILETRSTADKPPMEELYLRVRGAQTLDRKRLAVLREVVAWREGEAIDRNRPPQRLLKDEVLVNIVRQLPKSMDDLKNQRGFPGHVLDWLGPGLLKAVKEGLEIPREQWPEKQKPRYLDPGQQSLVSLLQALVRIKSNQMQLSTSLLATGQELEELVFADGDYSKSKFRMMNGWRREAIGDDIIRMLDGEIGIYVDKSTRQAIITSQK